MTNDQAPMTNMDIGMRPTDCFLSTARRSLVIGHWSLVILAGSLVIPACNQGPPMGKVHGKVTFKGQPVKEGTVTLLNLQQGGAYEATIGADGAYDIASPVAIGEYHVEIKPLMHMVDTDPGKSPPAPMEKPAPDIPKKYRQQGSTPLRANVKQGDNPINFEMTP
jgi:hypothetical protein